MTTSTMSTFSSTVRDSATMLRRELLHQRRYPSVTVMLIGMPIVFLLLFVYILGDTLGAGLSGPSGGRSSYVDYVVPGLLLIAIAAVMAGTAISVATDMTEGIVARFRTMAISRTAVLSGHVLGATIQTMLSVSVLFGVAFAIGFRPTTGFSHWVAALGVLVLIAVALTWVAVAMGTTARSIESASNLPMVFLLLPIFGNGFVPSDSLPPAVAWFAEYQPFTPWIDTVRGLLLGTPMGHSAVLTVAWCLAISVGGYAWARRSYDRHSVR
jgi:ABC-2 type transport system permease protein